MILLKIFDLFKTINNKVFAQPFTQKQATDVTGAFKILNVGINNLMLILRNLVLALGFLFILVGVTKLATGQGDPEKTDSGRQTVLWAIAAMLLSVVFWSIIKIVLGQMLGVKGIEDSFDLNITPPDF